MFRQLPPARGRFRIAFQDLRRLRCRQQVVAEESNGGTGIEVAFEMRGDDSPVFRGKGREDMQFAVFGDIRSAISPLAAVQKPIVEPRHFEQQRIGALFEKLSIAHKLPMPPKMLCHPRADLHGIVVEIAAEQGRLAPDGIVRDAEKGARRFMTEGCGPGLERTWQSLGHPVEIGLGQLDMVADKSRPELLLEVVIEHVQALPGTVIRKDPIPEQTGRGHPGTRAAGQQIEIAIEKFFGQGSILGNDRIGWVARFDFDGAARPEPAPRTRVPGVDGLPFLLQRTLGQSNGCVQQIGIPVARRAHGESERRRGSHRAVHLAGDPVGLDHDLPEDAGQRCRCDHGKALGKCRVCGNALPQPQSLPGGARLGRFEGRVLRVASIFRRGMVPKGSSVGLIPKIERFTWPEELGSHALRSAGRQADQEQVAFMLDKHRPLTDWRVERERGVVQAQM